MQNYKLYAKASAYFALHSDFSISPSDKCVDKSVKLTY